MSFQDLKHLSEGGMTSGTWLDDHVHGFLGEKNSCFLPVCFAGVAVDPTGVGFLRPGGQVLAEFLIDG